VPFEKLHDQRHRVLRKFMPAGMQIRHKLGSIGARLQFRVALRHGLRRIGLEHGSHEIDCSDLPVVGNNPIVLAGDGEDRARDGVAIHQPALRRRRTESGELLAARLPQHHRESRAVGMADGVDAVRINLVLSADLFDDRVGEMDVAVVLPARDDLPSGPAALRIAGCWCRQPL
jgi:hypothetical protein